MAQLAFITDLNAADCDQTPLPRFTLQRGQQRPLLNHRQIRMTTAALGPPLAPRQSSPQVVRPNPADMANA